MNIKTVAARAGVSVATVSRVMSGSALVRPETTAHVRRVIEELQFIPSASATTLKTGHSRNYGVILPDITNPYFAEFIREFESLLEDQRQDVLLATTERPERMENSIRRMLTSQVEGVVVLIADEEFGPNYDRLTLRNIPAVTIDRLAVAPMMSDVAFDFDTGMLEAVEHLAKFGHREIAFIGGIKGLATSDRRKQAFVKGMRACKLSVKKQWLLDGLYTVDSGDAAMRTLMTAEARPTAVIAVNDMTALGAMRAAHELGFSVPGDVSIIGLDDIGLTRVISPALTTIRLPRRELAQACVECFAHMLKHPKKPGLQRILESRLVVRRSTGAVRKR